MKNTPHIPATWTMTGVAAAALLLFHAGASALSLGRLNVQSALGEPLRAEIEITSITPDEADSLRLGMATTDAFKAAGVDYNPVLANAKVSLVRRPDGRQVVRIAGERAVSEPFVDMILDFAWSGGRLQRSYTLLVDPPIRATAPAAPVTAPALGAAPVPTAPAQPPLADTVPTPVATARVRAPRPAPAPRPQASAPAPVAEKAPAATPGEGYKVRKGDTLSRIAAAQAKPGVSLDQMLVALYHGNPQAFIGNNMNRLKAGAVLDVGAAQAQANEVTPAEARRVIQAQSADFSSFRHRLASAAPTVRGSEPARQAKGKVEAAVDDRKTAAAPMPDKLTLSKGAAKSATEAKLSKDTEKQAADQRVAELSRNVEELSRLSRNAQGGAAAAASVAASQVPGLAVGKAVPPPQAPSAPAKPAAMAPVPTPASAVAAASAAPLPASAPAPQASAPAPAPAASVPASAPPVAVPSPTAAKEPGFFDSLTDSPFVLPVGVALVATLAGLGVMRLRRKSEGSGETSFIESKMQPDSFFGATGGGRVDTRDGPTSTSSNSSSLSYSLSQLDAIGDVDPVAEADVYLAYGRDLQAEEILKEALRADGSRLAIRTKLLEVYAKRADAKAFEGQAQQLHEITQGQGEDWAHAAELGRQLDPHNALYAGTAAGASPAPAEAAVMDIGPLTSAAADAPTAPLDLPTPSAADVQRAGPPSDFDLDIDLDSPSQLTGLENTRPLTVSQPTLDLAEPTPSMRGVLDGDPVRPAAPVAAPAPAALDEDFVPSTRSGSLDSLRPVRTHPGALDDLPPIAPLPSAAERATGVSAEQAPKDAQPSGPVDFDFGDLSLDLDAPTTTTSATGTGELDLATDDPLARKLELADEFRQIGDVEGARDLLHEVIAKAEGALKAKAQSRLDEL